MTDQELKDLVASLAIASKKTDEQFRKTDEQFKKTDEQFRKTDEKLNKIGVMVGAIGNNQGDVAEEYFVNSLEGKLTVGNISFDYLVPNYTIKGKNIRDEYDILLVNGDSVAIIEVKYKVHPKDLEQLPKKINNLKKLAQYKNYKIYAGVAGFKVPNEVFGKAKEQGYFVLQRKGNVMHSYTEGLKAA